MLKTYVVLIFLCSIYITNAAKIEVEYDEENDLILNNGKIYSAVHDIKKSNFVPRILAHGAAEEEHVEGAQFWGYIFAILCKIF